MWKEMSLEFRISEVLVLCGVSIFLKLHTEPENNKLSGKVRRRQEGSKKANKVCQTPPVLVAGNCGKGFSEQVRISKVVRIAPRHMCPL